MCVSDNKYAQIYSKYIGSSSTKPNALSKSRSADIPSPGTPPLPDSPETDAMDAEAMKAEILLSLKADISVVINSELKNALTEDFDFLKSDSEIGQMKANIKEVEGGLSSWLDKMASLQSTVTDLKAEVGGLSEECEDMEGRMRRCNIRILGVAETTGSSSTALNSQLLRGALQLDKGVLMDCSHRSLASRRQDGKPRAVIANLHYYQDCAEVLRIGSCS